MELAPTADLFSNPRHAYTRRLLDAVLVPEPAVARARLAEFGTSVRAPIEVAEASELVEVEPGHWVRS